ncbi:oxaloacetate decarboxylase alpha chain [Neisseria sp. S1]|uniref:oxaloacetate decarboxylase alpha chain n=1 Tax=Neisseria sp. S1 TaxID=3318354 RepID=UPI003A88886D
MSNEKMKTTGETLGRVTGDYLKWEATPLTREAVAAPEKTKIGTFVDYPLREGKKLLALTDEQDGKVIVQPHNCIIDLSLVATTAVNAAASTGGNLEGLKKDGDPYGIVYQGTPTP